MQITPKVAILAVAGTVAYVGLAILGWGGVAAFVAHPALVAVAVATVVMSVVSMFTRGNLRFTGEREDRGNRWVLAAFEQDQPTK